MGELGPALSQIEAALEIDPGEGSPEPLPPVLELRPGSEDTLPWCPDQAGEGQAAVGHRCPCLHGGDAHCIPLLSALWVRSNRANQTFTPAEARRRGSDALPRLRLNGSLAF